MAETPSPEVMRFRDAIGRFATGVAIVTAHGQAGPAGLTTNAVSSLSLDPLMLIVCFDKASRTLPVVQESRRLAVNLLRAGHEDTARLFASKHVAQDKFDAVTHTVDHGVPVLDDALAWFVCDVAAFHEGGDHLIAVGQVTAFDYDPTGEPLLFHAGQWCRLLAAA